MDSALVSSRLLPAGHHGDETGRPRLVLPFPALAGRLSPSHPGPPPKTGIALGWYEVLAHLSQAPDGRLRFQDLARVVGITDSGASRRLNQMLQAGLIERFLCASDRRGVYALMTDKGKETYAKAHTVFIRSLERNLKQLEPGEAELVHTALSRLTSN